MKSLIIPIGRVMAIAIAFLLPGLAWGQGQPLLPEHDMGAESSRTFAEVQGRIEKVFVTQDEGSVLKVLVYYVGYNDAHITAEVLDHNKQPLRQIPAMKGSLAGKSSPVEITIPASTNIPDDGSVRSRYIKLILSRHPVFVGPNSPYNIYLYHKAWVKSVHGNVLAGNPAGGNTHQERTPATSNQNQKDEPAVISIVLEPIGSAAQLDKGKLPVPAKNVLADHTPTSSEILADSSAAQTQVIVDKRPRGPGIHRISLWDGLKSDVDFQFEDITNINLEVIRDANPHSNFFYYLPVSYDLEWDEAQGYKGYQLKNLYGTAAEEGGEGVVRIHATLSPKIDTRELTLVKALLASYAKNKLGLNSVELEVLPIAGVPQVSFSDELQNLYDVAASKVSINTYSDISRPLQVSWVTDARIKDEIVVALSEGIGVNGSMRLRPDGDSLAQQSIPVSISINSARTFGKFILHPPRWRKGFWQHHIPYPVRLNYLHVLMVKNDVADQPAISHIYSYNLGGKTVAPQDKVMFDARKMPVWIDRSEYTQLMWIDYSVLPCDACDEKVMEATLGGTSTTRKKEITFELFDVMATTGAQIMQVKVRSTQADPKGEMLTYLPSLRITEDKPYTAGPLYIGPGQSPSFEYQLSLIMPDGAQYHSQKWIPAHDLSVYLGMKNIQEAIPVLTHQKASQE